MPTLVLGGKLSVCLIMWKVLKEKFKSKAFHYISFVKTIANSISISDIKIYYHNSLITKKIYIQLHRTFNTVDDLSVSMKIM